jgi:hypothetical protein
VSSPARTLGATHSGAATTTVIGPGPNRSKSVRAQWLLTPRSASATLAQWTINGLSAGLPFAWNIDTAADSTVADAASPYTVSVGMTTRRPAAMSSPARRTARRRCERESVKSRSVGVATK